MRRRGRHRQALCRPSFKPSQLTHQPHQPATASRSEPRVTVRHPGPPAWVVLADSQNSQDGPGRLSSRSQPPWARQLASLLARERAKQPTPVARRRASTPPPPPKTLGEARDEWLRHIAVDRNCRPSTVRDYSGHSRRYIVGAFGADTPLEALTTEPSRRGRRSS